MALSASCGPPAHGPFFGDDKLIVLGVDPDSEADALAKQLQGRGLTERLRIRGKTFTALGFAPSASPEQQSEVRVITGRGIALALQARAADLLDPGVRYALLPAPYRDTLDADGDGFDELFALRTPLPEGESCILVYRVRDSGFVDPVPTDGYALARPPDVPRPEWQQPFCAEPARAKQAPAPAAAAAAEPPQQAAPAQAPTAVPDDRAHPPPTAVPADHTHPPAPPQAPAPAAKPPGSPTP